MLHKNHKKLSAHLSKELRTQIKRRSLPVRKGDTVVILRGEHKKKEDKIFKVDLKGERVYLEALRGRKVSGEEIRIPFNTSNLLLKELSAEDKERQAIFKRGKV